MHHQTIQVSKGGNLSGARCEKLHRPFLVQDPWLSSSTRMDEWEFSRADSVGRCPSDMENASGSEPRRVLEERNLHALSTFTPAYQPTWWSGRAQHRGRQPRKPWTSQRTAAMSVWTGPARHQLHIFKKVLKLANAKCIMLAWRNVIVQIEGRV